MNHHVRLLVGRSVGLSVKFPKRAGSYTSMLQLFRSVSLCHFRFPAVKLEKVTGPGYVGYKQPLNPNNRYILAIKGETIIFL